jgi:hypothetical protein
MITNPLIAFIADPNEPDFYNDVNSLPNPFTMNIPWNKQHAPFSYT